MSIIDTVLGREDAEQPEPEPEPEAEPEPVQVDMPVGDALDIIRNDRRRLTIRFILDADRSGQTPVAIGDLADQIGAIENDCEPDELSSKQRKRPYVGLTQTHLPALCEAGVLEEVDPGGSYRPTDLAKQLGALSSIVAEHCGGGVLGIDPKEMSSERAALAVNGGEASA